MHLVDDEHLILAKLRWDARLLHKCLDMLHAVVRGSIEFEDVQGTLFVERLATLTRIAGLAVYCGALAVDGLGEDTGTGGLSHATRAAEEIGVSQFSALHGILQRGGESRLSDNRVEGDGAVLSCRNDIFHIILEKLWCKVTHFFWKLCNFANEFMKVLDNIKVLALKVWRSQALKYTVVVLLGVLVVGFLDENSIWSHFKNQRRISELEEEIDKYNAAYERDQAKIRQLNKDPKAMEKIARERYFMKADDEDIYVLSDDERDSKPIVTNETTD